MTGTEQRMSALAEANERRVRKARMKEDWRTQEQHVLLRELARLLEEEPDALQSFKIDEMLRTVRGIGPSKMKMLAKAADYAEPSYRVSRLTDRQRRLLAQVLRDRANDVEGRGVQAA